MMSIDSMTPLLYQQVVTGVRVFYADFLTGDWVAGLGYFQGLNDTRLKGMFATGWLVCK